VADGGDQSNLTAVQTYRSLLRRIDPDTLENFVDISGADPALGIAVYEKFECDIFLLPLDAGDAKAANWTGAYRDTLIAAGVPKSSIKTLKKTTKRMRFDLVGALHSFGYNRKINALKDFLSSHLNDQSRMLIDIKRGSGGYPFLKKFGNATTIEETSNGVFRVALIVEPKAPDDGHASWGAIAKTLIGTDGFYRQNDKHSLTFVKRSDTLLVTFDNLDIAMNKREDRRPWGFSFIEAQGWSMLGVMANGWTWFRDAWLSGEFDRLRDEGFFDQFQRVIFYGASMGGYAALTFSSAAPQADVLAFSPQSVLDKELVPWETRYRIAWDYDYSDHYGDAAVTIAKSRRVNLFFDPFSPLDKAHIDRLNGPNVRFYRAPFLGHRLASSMQQMGILQDVILATMDDTLNPREFAHRLRARRDGRRYKKETVDRLIDRGRAELAARLCRHFLTQSDDMFFQRTLARLENQKRKS
jgi:pimeloyl-ACP methyl ester carboxylesterase